MSSPLNALQRARHALRTLALEHPVFAGPPEDEVERAERDVALSTLEAAVGELDDEQLGNLCWCHPDFLSVRWEEMPKPIRAELIRRGLGAKVEGAWRIHRAVVVLALGVSPDDGRAGSTSAAARRMLEAVVQRAPAEAIAYYLAGRETSVPGARRRCLESARPLVIAATHTRRRPPR